MTDIKTVAEVRSALGAYTKIGVDANMAWNFDTVETFTRETITFNLANIEEPVSDLKSMDKLARRYNVNISSHCTSIELLSNYNILMEPLGSPMLKD